MLIPVVSGEDKTTVSVATGHQEYHPVYVSPGNISNVARRSHGDGVLPVAFLPIAKCLLSIQCQGHSESLTQFPGSKRQRKKQAFKTFQRQLYHACLELVFSPLKPYMEEPTIVKCPDGHFRRGIFDLGPHIDDYPEQVWLTGIVQGWCPKYVFLVMLNIT